ncbi:MAG: hypothetical protein WBA13_08300 [Microcoleaceae cyanobacterium]
MRFNFQIYGLISAILIGLVSGINWLIDPLWHSKGNRLTGQNFAFNERLSKTNQFLKTKDNNYDCIIFGSSRVITLNASTFENQNCFNYSFKGGFVEDFVQYAQFIKEQGIQPKTVYIGVDGYNFVKREKFEKANSELAQVQRSSFYDAYFSLDVFTFSAMTLLGMSPDPANYYNQQFEPAEFDNKPTYTPAFHPPQPPQECDPSQIEQYQQLKQIFPDSEFIAYVPLRSAWAVVTETYERNLMDCYLESFYQISQLYTHLYDFSIPSQITKDPKNTWDGSHYFTWVNDEVVEILQGKPPNFGIQVDQYSYEEYRDQYLQALKKFMEEKGELDRWQQDTLSSQHHP